MEKFEDRRNLFYRDAKGKVSLVSVSVTLKETIPLINQYCFEHNLNKPYYYRTWKVKAGTKIDYGSYVAFFYWSSFHLGGMEEILSHERMQ